MSVFKSPTKKSVDYEGVKVGCYQKLKHDLLTEGNHPIFHKALFSLFVRSHGSVPKAEEDYFATTAFNHFLAQTCDIYFAADANDKIIAYMLADGDHIHQLFVSEAKRSGEIAATLLNLLQQRNKTSMAITFLLSHDHSELRGYLEKLEFRPVITTYDKVLYPKSMVRVIPQQLHW